MSEKKETQRQENQFSVVINHEDQYSIWPRGKEIPNGWQKEGKTGNKSDCLDYINNAWSDIRPKSIRRKNNGPGSS